VRVVIGLFEMKLVWLLWLAVMGGGGVWGLLVAVVGAVVVAVVGRNDMGERDFMLRPETMLAVAVSGMRWLSGWLVAVFRLSATFGLLLLLLLVLVVVVVRLMRFCWAGGCFKLDASDCLFMIVVRLGLLKELNNWIL